MKIQAAQETTTSTGKPHSEPVAGGPEPLWKKRETARLASVSTRTLENWTRQGRIPIFRIGRTVRFRWSDVAAALDKFRINGGTE